MSTHAHTHTHTRTHKHTHTHTNAHLVTALFLDGDANAVATLVAPVGAKGVAHAGGEADAGRRVAKVRVTDRVVDVLAHYKEAARRDQGGIV